MIVVSSVLDCLGLHRLSTPYDLLSPAIEDISGRHIAQRLVVRAEVVVVNEVSDGPLQLAGEYLTAQGRDENNPSAPRERPG